MFQPTLPTAEQLKNRRVDGVKRTNISHAHSADRIVASYCGVALEGVNVPGYWQHGWLPSYYSRHPALISLHKKDKAKPSEWRSSIDTEKVTHWQWVAREDQAAYLREHGYQKVGAIGLPFAYLPDPCVRREPGSLLVMPPHGREIHFPGEAVSEAYADYIEALKPHFSKIVVSVTEGDIVRGEWVDLLQRRGLLVTMGSNPFSVDPLVTVQRMLASCEFVTTNCFGSHIVYAAHCGCRVSVAGPYAEWPRARIERAYAPKMFPELTDVILELTSEGRLRSAYPFLFVEPQDGETRMKWGAHEIGATLRRSPADLADLFGLRAAARQPEAAQIDI